jgi:3-dehydroquinate synthase
MRRVEVALAERSYSILIGTGLIDRAAAEVRPLLARPRAVVVTDETVAGLHLPGLRESFAREAVACAEIVVPPGEGSKDFGQLERLLDRLLELRIERSDLILALGGGVVGDLAGFAAAILKRGVDYVQIPTTLLAQVDSSVGGKTAVNARAGKNLIGAFHQPRLVLADIGALATLPARQLRAGWAEVLKYGLLGDFAFFERLERDGAKALAGDSEALAQAVETSCRAKAAIVARDERETGERALLNLGHTFGHALEAETGMGDRLLHGEAVAIGMALAFDLSADLGLCPRQDAARAARAIAAAGLPASPRQAGLGPADAPALLAHMRQDKKARDGRLVLVLARRIGDAFVARDVPAEAVEAALARALAG